MFERFADSIAAWTGKPWALALAVAASLTLWRTVGPDDAMLAVSFLAWWQLFPLQHSANRNQASQDRDTAAIRAAVRELVRAVPEADDHVIDRETAS